MNVWDTQQTAETIAARYSNLRFISEEEAAKQLKEYNAEKLRKCKIRMINAWRAKHK